MQLPAHICPDKLRGPFKLINGELARVRQLILSFVCEDSTKTIKAAVEPVRNTIFRGKMIRPVLVLLSAKTAGRITDEHIRLAALIETIHNATLLHDDVLDEALKRRGAPTVSNLLGNESAVLLGDFLLSKVFSMCADLKPQIVRIIAAAATRTCQGELRQIIQRQNWQLSESEYIDIITDKSAALFSSSCELGGLAAGADETQLRSLSDFGFNIGIAFQITDDLLDIVGNERDLGKTPGIDVDKSNLTLPVIHLLSTVDTSKKNEIIEQLNAGRFEKESITDLLKRRGSLRYAEVMSQNFVAKAVDSLADLKESDAKSALVETARFIADRAGIRCL